MYNFLKLRHQVFNYWLQFVQPVIFRASSTVLMCHIFKSHSNLFQVIIEEIISFKNKNKILLQSHTDGIRTKPIQPIMPKKRASQCWQDLCTMERHVCTNVCYSMGVIPFMADTRTDTSAVSYTHLDVYKRQL